MAHGSGGSHALGDLFYLQAALQAWQYIKGHQRNFDIDESLLVHVLKKKKTSKLSCSLEQICFNPLPHSAAF